MAALEKPFEILDRIARLKPLAAKLASIIPGQTVAFEQVTEAARPFLAALIASCVKRRAWVVCANVREQEIFYNELLNWFPGAVFLPAMELAPAQGAVPDPEIAAERLRILQNLAASRERHVIVVLQTSFILPMLKEGTCAH